MQKIEELREQSSERLARLQSELETRLQVIDPPSQLPGFCIYATGSLARLEANPASDLDAFFLLEGNSQNSPLSRIRDVKILNAIVEIAEQQQFPDFSNDGEYLRFLHVEEMIERIGHREDDYHNMLTARMLLILESAPLYNCDLYEEMRSRVVGRYFSDFHKHNRDFKPIFLLNDVLRFWRTICLNYENGRWWRTADKRRNAKGHLANLKLRFSRLSICYTFVAKLLSLGQAVEMTQVLDVSRMTPLDRLSDLRGSVVGVERNIDELFRQYDWFLQMVSRPKDEVLQWISEKANREEAFSHGDQFVQSMYNLVFMIAEKNSYQRYLVI